MNISIYALARLYVCLLYTSEDYGEELEDYDGEEDGPPWDEDEDENEDTEDGE